MPGKGGYPPTANGATLPLPPIPQWQGHPPPLSDNGIRCASYGVSDVNDYLCGPGTKGGYPPHPCHEGYLPHPLVFFAGGVWVGPPLRPGQPASLLRILRRKMPRLQLSVQLSDRGPRPTPHPQGRGGRNDFETRWWGGYGWDPPSHICVTQDPGQVNGRDFAWSRRRFGQGCGIAENE
jgi:hypothetical protein